MSIQVPRVRRLATIVAVIAALVVGYGSIRAAAAWTAASAPLSVAPVPVSALQDRLAVEQARSEDLRAQLETLTAQSTEMTAALEAAQSQIVTDTDHANALAKQLKDAKKKLAKLEASIAKAKRAAPATDDRRHEDQDRRRLVEASATTTTRTRRRARGRR